MSEKSIHPELKEIPDPFQRLAECTRLVVTHIKDGKYDRVVVSGGSREVSKTLFEKGWKKLYPNLPCPVIDEIDKKGNAYLYKQVQLNNPRISVVDTWLSENNPGLKRSKDKRISFLDEYAYKGTKVRSIKELFKKIGFQNVDFTLFASSGIADIGEDVFVASPDDNDMTLNLKTLSRSVQGENIRPFAKLEDSEKIKKAALEILDKIIAKI